jgi:hypothetical protein
MSSKPIEAAPQQPTPAAAPIPSDLLQARKIYLENAGSSPELYARFTAAMSAWGHYTLIDSVTQADVVFEFHSQPVSVVMEEPSTGVVLWTVNAPYVRPSRDTNRMAALDIENLVSSIKQLNGIQLTQQETAAITPPNPGKRTTMIDLIAIVGSLVVAVSVFLLLHGQGHK